MRFRLSSYKYCQWCCQLNKHSITSRVTLPCVQWLRVLHGGLSKYTLALTSKSGSFAMNRHLRQAVWKNRNVAFHCNTPCETHLQWVQTLFTGTPQTQTTISNYRVAFTLTTFSTWHSQLRQHFIQLFILLQANFFLLSTVCPPKTDQAF